MEESPIPWSGTWTALRIDPSRYRAAERTMLGSSVDIAFISLGYTAPSTRGP